jgi:ribokinase
LEFVGSIKSSMTKNHVLVIGSSNTDMIVKAARIPKPGETILGGEFATCAGGKGANQAFAAVRAGAKVTFIGCVGQDMFGERALAGLKAEGINLKYAVRDKSRPSGVALIVVGDSGENSIAVASGSNASLRPTHLRKAKGTLRTAKVVLLQLETPMETVRVAAQMANQAGVPVILNPAPAQSLPTALLKRIYLLTPNESEAEILTGMRVRTEVEAAKAAARLRARGVENVIITMGARGALLATKDFCGLIPAQKVKAVDATAAGDVFNGAVAVALAEGKSLTEAAHFANAAAAISVTRLGAQTSVPTRAEIERMLALAAA